MIQIKNLVTGEIKNVVPTIFPDGTSQVWKVDYPSFRGNTFAVIWYFEHESELIHVLQLLDLLFYNNYNVVELYIPYLPYGRQDKEISNVTTFALHTFTSIIRSYIKKYGFTVSTLDIHSKQYVIKNYSADRYINKAIDESKVDVIIYPDQGASNRYILGDIPFVILEKERDQLTGTILGMKFSEETIDVEIEGKRVLIVDDISDYGGTFKQAAKLLMGEYVDNISLYVTHFLGHGELDDFNRNGISKIYTTSSLSHYRNKFHNINDKITIFEISEF